MDVMKHVLLYFISDVALDPLMSYWHPMVDVA